MSDRCKYDNVANSAGWGLHRCDFKAKKDGYCLIHHPEKIIARQQKSAKKEELRWHNSSHQKLQRANTRIAELEELLSNLSDRYLAQQAPEEQHDHSTHRNSHE